MKPIRSLVAVIALSLIAMPVVRAQETETPTEKATPSPTEKAEPEKSEPEKKSEAEPSHRTAEKSEASPSAKTSTTASAKPAVKGSVDAQLKDIENRWEAAFQNHDIKAVEPMLADSYVLTNEKGKILNRSGAIREFKKNSDTYEKATNSDVVVHMINKDAAVVTGMSHEVGKEKGGKAFDRTYRWTDTFVNRNGRWECAATQVTLVAQK